MASSAERLLEIAARLSKDATVAEDSKLMSPLNRIAECAEAVGKSSSQSWFGYHSKVYYAELEAPPPGAHFSREWGLMNVMVQDTTGDWREYAFDDVVEAIMECAKHPDLSRIEKEADAAKKRFEDEKAEIMSAFTIALQETPDDKFIQELKANAAKERPYTAQDFVETVKPKGQFISRDSVAINAGTMVPPHVSVRARVAALKAPFLAADRLAKLCRRAASHLQNLPSATRSKAMSGTRVFIGHGGSRLWKDLKDFISDRLNLPWDEFNRVPVAGTTNIERLSQMLDSASLGLLVLTAEDEQADNTMNPRLNVVHEAGLFQGRLGFSRAIILLEEGCREFSNIHGLGQIRFPMGKIEATFEEIRRVLEREGLIT